MAAHGFRAYPWWIKLLVGLTAVVVLLVAIGLLYGLWRLNVDEPVVYGGEPGTPEAAAWHFKHGSLGGERGYYWQLGFGVPYWVWVALPELFPEYLPDPTPGQGYASFGYLYEPGVNPRFEMPVGTSRRNVMGIDRVWLTCASCHTGTVRESPDAEPMMVLGMPANRYDQGRWAKFLFATARSEKFASEYLSAKVEELVRERRVLVEACREKPDECVFADVDNLPHEPDLVERIALRTVLAPILRKRLLMLGDRLESFVDVESWGPGRVDTFNSPKALLNFPMKRARDRWPDDIEPELQGNVDFPSIWYQKPREGMQLHWDGNNTSVDERNLSAGFAASTPPTLDKCSLIEVREWLMDAAPPAFPESRIDRDLAAQGQPIYYRYCAGCHGGPDPPFKHEGVGKLLGTVVPVAAVGTDRRRLDSYTLQLAQAQGTLYAGYPLAHADECAGDPRSRTYPSRFTHFRKTDGYANAPLDGLWLRAPYLHNGSVPNMRQLLAPCAERATVFWIGYDVYDYDNLGFVTSGPLAEAEGWRYDTSVPGNGNCGHEGPAYGTELPAGEKDALIEYLKTF